MLDIVIFQLLEAKTFKVGTFIDIHEKSIKYIVKEAVEVFKNESTLLELESPLKITGDFHGQFYDLIRLMDGAGGHPPEHRYLFVGDFVDRGKQSIETLLLLLAYKLKYPEMVYLLRGNHECNSITRMYGFYDECKRRYSISLWRDFCVLFNYLPISAIVDERILCMHGGLSPELSSINCLNVIKRPRDVPDSGLLCDILWSDPEK